MDEVEIVARAICSANGSDPDEVVKKGDDSWPMWYNYRPMARQFIAAYNVMKS